LEKHLPAVINNSTKINKIIIIDDGSTDDTDKFINQKYPQLIYLKNKTNLGFTKSINLAAQESQADFVVLLNNDVSPEANYLDEAIKRLNNKNVFAVTFNENKSSWPNVFWLKGKLQFKEGEDKTKARFVAWASGGSAIFRKSIWNELGGFDEIYSPGYWEDIDLGWRAWKLNCLIIWEPKAKVIHQHQSSFNKIDPNYINLIKQRNELIFTWKNITDFTLKLSHMAHLIGYTFTHLGYLKVIVAVFKQLRSYQWPTVNHKFSDKKILDKINRPISND